MRRVVVTGLGVVAPNGHSKEAFWDACVNGRSGISEIESFDASGHPVRIAGEVKDFDVSPFVDNKKSLKVMGRNVRFGVGAAGMAMRDSGLDSNRTDPTRFGVTVGSGMVPIDFPELANAVSQSLDESGRFSLPNFAQAGRQSLFPLWVLKHLPNMVAAHISILHNAQGPNNTITTACAAGSQAIGEAMRLIARDDADLMLAGGADSRVDPLLMITYALLGVLSNSQRPPAEVSRPFDSERDGFVIGEGAAMLVLEELEHARRRGAEIYAEVIGYGSSFDAHSLTRPDPTGGGAARSMHQAIKEARISPDDVDYINAHGTSTRINDVMETRAVKAFFGDRAPRTPMSSIKSMIGHLIGAAGAVEAAATVLSLKRAVLPPTINQTAPDPECDLDYVPNIARESKPKVILSNSFGFGGQNATLIMREFPNGRAD